MTEPSATAPRILVIDDEPQIRRFLDISLRAQGYAVEMADTGQSGLEALARHGADLVILDLGLPDLDGQHVLRELWGPTHEGDTHYLRILVGKLRQKLGDNAASPRWIATEPGVGLRFIG